MPNSPQELLDRIETGKADWGYTLAKKYFEEPGRALIVKYGLNKSRFFVTPGLTMIMFVLNSSRPLFKDNPKLRQAVNLAIDRFAFIGPAATQLTDQHLPPLVAGYRDRRIYPFQADLARAKALAAGNLRGGKAVLYMPNCAGTLFCAQLVKRQLAEIGLEVEIRPIAEYATASAYLGRLGDPDEPWDLALGLWTPDFVDPFGYINRLLDAQDAGGTNLARFDEGDYQTRMRGAARLEGAARAQAYRELDLELARDAAPVVPLHVLNEATLVSARTGCLLLRPGLVLTKVCLKR